MSLQIASSIANGVLEIALNRIEKKNALTTEMYQALAEKLLEAQYDNTISSILIRGQNGAFCAGNDIEDFLTTPPVRSDAPTWKFFDALMQLDKPVVAAVDGLAVGVGATMLLHCDFVYATPGTTFLMPFTGLGITPEGASTVLLPLLVGRQRAAKMLLLGKRVDAAELHLAGMVTEVVSPVDLLGIARATAVEFTALPLDIVRKTKRLMRDGIELLVNRQYAAERELLRETVQGDAAKRAFERFTKKTK
ncbi:enoyl-CoA hydratase-related protein [Cupriavidus sp. 2SB]|uniref:enoyl-CoA hydratase-related protein n=1 Tax=Cupriavidus sp. 2SB TaxID=2502199 RepID=UPI0010F8D379|nr:enoyl-CoA hydratase-related protein [Cupriavidus sp. 2SB]